MPAATHPPDADLTAFGRDHLPAAEADAVRRHLDGCDGCRQRAVDLKRAGETNPAGGTDLFAGQSQAGQRLADLPTVDHVPEALTGLTQYTDLRELGRGGMGVVYLARHTLLDRLVVLKVASRELLAAAGQDAADRFLREMRSAAKLTHPNVVAAHDAFRHGDVLVFVMEYAAGEDLAKVLARKGPLPVPTACFYAHCVALGLQHAHERGLVHRDIKPQNLIQVKTGTKAVVKVLDFGLAKVTRQAGGTGPTMTNMGMGTPAYMAPEQWRDAGGVDIRADIYSLGCTLYCLLAGHPPFRGNQYALMQAHCDTPAPTVTAVRPDVPAELSAAVAKMLAKNPADRYQTPAEVAAALREFIKPGAKTATPDPPPARVVTQVHDSVEPLTPARRRWVWPVVAAGTLAVALLAAAAGGVFKARTPNGVQGDKELVTVGGEPVTARVEPPTKPRQIELTGGKPKLSTQVEPQTKTTESPPPPPYSLPPEDDFTPLFNGRDLTGWKVEKEEKAEWWSVRDGAIVGSKPEGLLHWSYLLADGKYDDFALRFEFQFAKPNALGAVAVRALPDLKAPKPAGGNIPHHPRLDLAGPGRVRGPGTGHPVYLNGMFGGPPTAARPAVEVGRWHAAEVVAHGDICTMSVDGKPVIGLVADPLPVGNTKKFLPGLKRKSGQVGFMIADGSISFRNVRTARLDGTPPPRPATASGTATQPDEPDEVTPVVSRFTVGDSDGWRATGPSRRLDVRRTGDNFWLFAGGSAADEKGSWGFFAPPKFRGDQSDKFNTLLKYRVWADKVSSPKKDRDGECVRLIGNGTTIIARERAAGRMTEAGWKEFAIPLDTHGGWRNTFGGVVGNDEIRRVLAKVDSLFIDMGHLGVASGGLDDVILGAED